MTRNFASLAGELAETFRQLGVELEDRAGLGAAQLLVELVDDHRGADAVQEVGGGESFDRLAVDGAGDVDRRVRVVDEREVGVGEIGEAIAQRVDLLVDVLVGDRRERQLDAQLVVTDELHLRTDLDDRVELDVAVLLTGGDLDLGRRDHVDVVLVHRVDVVLRAARPAAPARAPSRRRDALRGDAAAPCPDGNRECEPPGRACGTRRRSRARIPARERRRAA